MGRYSDPTANMAISNVMKEMRKREMEARKKAGSKKAGASETQGIKYKSATGDMPAALL